MSTRADAVYAGIIVRPDDAAVLHVLERAACAADQVGHGMPLPGLGVGSLTETAPTTSVGFTVWNGAVVGLSLRDCSLTALPDDIGRLTELRALDLSGNRLTDLAASLCRLGALQRLVLDGNRLTALPAGLAELRTLRALHVDANELEVLTEAIASLTRLETLHARGN
jgi:Leucine-rich repeat (LRR) protein